MASATVNGQQVEVSIIQPDLSASGEGLTGDELAVVSAVDAAVRATASMRALAPAPKLERVESNRGLADDRQGRYYLRYRKPDGSASEWWGHAGKQAKVDEKKGIVAVTKPAGHAPA